MKEINVSSETLLENTDENISAEGKKRKWTLIVYFCGIGGIIIGLSGLFLSGVAYFEFFDKAHHLHIFGTLLIVLAFPLIMFGAHALDKIKKLDR